jgi:hypothetical protein
MKTGICPDRNPDANVPAYGFHYDIFLLLSHAGRVAAS